MRRRSFIKLLGAAAMAWPAASRAQQPAKPAIGFLVSATREGYADVLAEIDVGLREAGLVEGRNVAKEYRYADEQYGRLPALAADLVGKQVAAIFATGSIISAMIAKAATTTIPIVFANGSDPVKYGLVPSLARPGGNITGVSYYNSALGPKRLELLREMLPNAAVVAFLVNPDNPNADPDAAAMQEAGRAIGVRILMANARHEEDFDAVFAAIRAAGAAAMIVNNDTLFQSRHRELVALANRHTVPTMWAGSRFAPVGGLVSYGTDIAEMNRQAGLYLGRILRGEKPANLPVLQPTKFQLIVNLATAKALGLTISESFLLRADKVIE